MAKKKTFLLFTILFLYFTVFSQNKSTITASANSKYQKPFLYKIFLGWHYRKLWATPVQAPIFYMDSISSGLRLFDIAGDLQSIRLKFTDSSGNKFSFKMLDKDQSKFLSPFLRRTFIGYITRDLASALNPYAAMALSPMATAIGLKIPNFQLYYLPPDNRYEQNLSIIKGRLGYFYPPYKSLNEHTLSTNKFLQKRFAKNDFKVDTVMYAKERLFNLLTGDFDRHRDQWDWEESKINDLTIITPLAKDYDMAFSKFRDGILPFLITKAQPIMQQFNKKIKTKSMVKTGSYLDHLLLSGLTRDNWIMIADSIKYQLTDSVLINSLRNMPKEVFETNGQKLYLILKSRRDQLNKAAEEMYEILNKKVIIAGSDKSEKAIITRLNKNETSVTIIQLSKHHEEIKFNRIFNTRDTKSISIYLLGEEDEFELNENESNKIKIKLYGGLQEDTYYIHGRKKIIIYDTKAGNTIYPSKRIRKKLTRKSTKHSFEREGY